MSICLDGLDAKIKQVGVTTIVDQSDPLVQLANKIDWNLLGQISLPDLKKTAKGFWQTGRKLSLRIHLSAMILQNLLKTTDRGIEEMIQKTPRYQVFCGYGSVSTWHCPDHTKIEEFRNRLYPETRKLIGDAIVKLACCCGFADPSQLDIDSTVQEANISYPSDACLMLKLAKKCVKVFEAINHRIPLPQISIKQIANKAKAYFFLAKNTTLEKRQTQFKQYFQLVKRQLKPIIRYCEGLTPFECQQFKWNIQKCIQQISQYGWRYLLDVAHFIRTHTIKQGKRLAFHCQSVACIRKGKVGKENEFGRVFQLGRIKGNFIIPFTCTNITMPDKLSLIPAIEEFQDIFGKDILKSLCTDKGYYTQRNIKELNFRGINSDGVLRPKTVKEHPSEDVVLPLRNRRAGIEPLIGHIKEFGLRKSKMKSDHSTLSAGYRSILGFNLHQMIRHIKGVVV